MTHTCLGLAGAKGPILIEGPMSADPEYLNMLAALCSEGVTAFGSSTGTSRGAALLFGGSSPSMGRQIPTPKEAAALAEYAKKWRQAVEAEP
jgi:sugar (pentulose or hexulose) kinase